MHVTELGIEKILLEIQSVVYPVSLRAHGIIHKVMGK